MSLAKLNLKNLKDIEDYKKVHRSDFSQVYFKPGADNIKSEKVGVYIKDINNQDRVIPFKRMPGLHTQESCKYNAAIVANSKIDYQTKNSYKPGLRYTVINGDFAGSPNHFLSVDPKSDEVMEPSQFQGIVAGMSVEIRGYIAAQKPGTYRVDLRNKKPPKHMLVWIGNNALKTYRTENAIFVVQDRVIKTEKKTSLVIGEYTPFRMQYSLDAGDTNISVENLLYNNDNYPITVFGTNDSENGLFYYALTPTTQSSYYECNIYKGAGLQLNNSNDDVQQVIQVWSMELPDNTDSVRLDMTGSLYAYDAEFSKIGGGTPLVAVSNGSAKPFNLVLDDTLPTPFYITNGTSKTNITVDDITTETVPNNKWKKIGVKKSLSNASAQTGGNKVISVDKITEANPMISENFKLSVQIMAMEGGKKKLVLLASVSDNRIFYTVEPDIKTNKLFYASTFINNKYLKEVPDDMKDYANSTSYSSYKESYPDPSKSYETVDCALVNKNYYYKVTDESTNAESCLQPIYTDTTPTFLPKQPGLDNKGLDNKGSDYKTSTLYIKNPKIFTKDANKHQIYNDAEYISNGFAHRIESGFDSYPVEKDPLNVSDMPGPEGTSYVAKLINQVSMSTNGTKKIYNPIEMKPMIAGKIEGMTVNEQSLQTIDVADAGATSYNAKQNMVNSNYISIGSKIANITGLYTDMSNNNVKYDFVGTKVQSLDEDRSLSAALLKDNSIYLAEQNNLYLVGTLTMATLLITAIFVSK
jgi:hypothetical protein